MQRRLAAILIADVVGYSRLSQIDDEGTRLRFQADQRDVFEPAIAAHSGRLVKTMGDAFLVEFGSVVDAVRCAVEIQRAKVERNSGFGTDRRLDFRIGINIGDIIVEGDDISWRWGHSEFENGESEVVGVRSAEDGHPRFSDATSRTCGDPGGSQERAVGDGPQG